MSTLWDKLSSWFSNEVKVAENDAAAAINAILPILSKDEQELLTLVKPLLAAAEASATQDLIQFIRGVVAGAGGYKTLADWETAVMNGLVVLGGDLLTIAKNLGSNSLQALIGLVLAQFPQSQPTGS